MKVKLSRADNGLHVATVGLDCGSVPGRIYASAVGDTSAAALSKAASIAEQIASDPTVQALIPPQALAAIKVAKKLASYARRGPRMLRRAWGFLSPKSKRLAKELVKEVAPSTEDVGSAFSNAMRRKLLAKMKRKRKANAQARETDEGADNDDSDEGEE